MSALARHLILVASVAWIWAVSAPARAARKPSPPRPLSISELQRMKGQPCTFITVWATWCSPCMNDMPQLVSWLGKLKKVNRVLLDVSEPYLQGQISKRWKLLTNAPFPTYLKPGGNNEAYFKAIDSNYDGALPFSVLYKKGKRVQLWRGAYSYKKMEAEISRICR